MSINNWNGKSVEVTSNGTTITTHTYRDGNPKNDITAKVYHDKDGNWVKGDFYRGDLLGEHDHMNWKDGKVAYHRRDGKVIYRREDN